LALSHLDLSFMILRYISRREVILTGKNGQA
jgi:hypothetical protein